MSYDSVYPYGNSENFEKLIMHLKGVQRFDMQVWISVRDENNADATMSRHSLEEHKCGTVMCIGGLCNLIEYYEKNPDKAVDQYFTSLSDAADWLAIQARTASMLFYVESQHGTGDQSFNMKQVTHAMALDAIDNVRRHNDPRWPEVFANHDKEYAYVSCEWDDDNEQDAFEVVSAYEEEHKDD